MDERVIKTNKFMKIPHAIFQCVCFQAVVGDW